MDWSAVSHKVQQALYANDAPTDKYRTFVNHLLEAHIISDDGFEKYHQEISELYKEWRKGAQALQRNPTCQSSAFELPSPQSPPSASNSPPENNLSGAVKSIVESRWSGPSAAYMYTPNNPSALWQPVTIKRTQAPRTFIRAKTLSTHNIEWKGETVKLAWKAFHTPEHIDESVQHHRFHVVSEEEALDAKMNFDMLIGTDDKIKFQEQMPTLRTRTSFSDSPSTDQSDEDSSQPPEESRSITVTVTQTQFTIPLQDLPIVLRHTGMPREPTATSNESLSASRTQQREEHGTRKRKASDGNSAGSRKRSKRSGQIGASGQ